MVNMRKTGTVAQRLRKGRFDALVLSREVPQQPGAAYRAGMRVELRTDNHAGNTAPLNVRL